jgi:hypothetical protein
MATTTTFRSRKDIPTVLLDAKKSAIADFLTKETAEPLAAFAARPSPSHNVVGIGIGQKFINGKATDRHSIRFYVERKLPDRAIPKEFMLPARIGNIPTDVIETGAFHAFGPANPQQARIRPAQPGCSIGFQVPGGGSIMAGTFGAVVELNGNTYILSNNHVLADENQLPIGSPIFQPGLLDKDSPKNDQIAKLTKFVKITAGGPNQVDCAIAEVLDKKLVSAVIMPKVGKLKSGLPVGAAEGMSVEKTGRTTGYTQGVIHDISADVKITYDVGLVTFTEQVLIAGIRGSFSLPGDSGSLIVDRKTKQPVALLFAGSPSQTIANHIDDVIQALGVTIVA